MTVLIPHSLNEAVQMLAETSDAHLLTGGTDMMVEVNFNHRRPSNVISLGRVPELSRWSVDTSTQTVFIGASVPYADMEHGELAVALPALAAAARTVGSPQIRAAGSLGGNLGTCSPAGDSLPVLAAMNAAIHLHSVEGERIVPFSDFMTGPKKNSCGSHEIITGVTLPISNGWQGYSKVGVRNAMVISVASCCLAWQDNMVLVALGSVGPIIIRCYDTEQWLNAQKLSSQTSITTELAQEFGRRAAIEARPIDDHRSTAEYRKHAISVLAKRLLQRGTQQ